MTIPTTEPMGNLTRPDGYLRESRRPLTSLVFVLPLLAVYEGGVLVLGMSGVRNGADVWLRQLLELLGFGGYFLLPVLTIGALLAWHHVTQEPWRVRPTVLYGMFVESVLLGLVLLLVAHQQARWFAATTSGPAAPCLAGIFGGVFDWLGRLVAFFGAGIYEEVLFRLLLFPAIAWLAAAWGAPKLWPAAIGLVVSSLIFSAAHYVGTYGDTFTFFSFFFRFSAGAFFALLFVTRGFGIAAGAHAAYDILAGLF